MILAVHTPIFSRAKKGGENMAKRCRSAITGRFVKESYANKHPKTTVKESIKKSK